MLWGKKIQSFQGTYSKIFFRSALLFASSHSISFIFQTNVSVPQIDERMFFWLGRDCLRTKSAYSGLFSIFLYISFIRNNSYIGIFHQYLLIEIVWLVHRFVRYRVSWYTIRRVASFTESIPSSRCIFVSYSLAILQRSIFVSFVNFLLIYRNSTRIGAVYWAATRILI